MLSLALLLVALICFILAAAGLNGRLVAAGLACWVGALLVPQVHL